MASLFGHSSTGIAIVNAFETQVRGKTFLITGASAGGIGAETALSLAHGAPSLLLLAGRSEEKIAPLLSSIGTPPAEYVHLDLADQASVRAAAAKVAERTKRIDVLINNAAVMAFPSMQLTPQGVEEQFGVNHLGHFLFTNLLTKRHGVEVGRVVNVTSMAFTLEEVRFGDINFQDGKEYHPWKGYGQSKTANVLFTKALAARGIPAYAAHPGVLSTNLVRHADSASFARAWQLAKERNGGNEPPREKGKTLQQGCATPLMAALDPGLKGQEGAFLRDCNVWKSEAEPVPEYASDPATAEKLWGVSEELVGERFA